MGLFDRLQKKKQVDHLPPKTVRETENINDFMIAMFDLVSEKSQYGADISALSEPERLFLITQQVETEVNNGGFSQYFFNSGGDLANEMVHAFMEIGAEKTAEICKKALEAFGGAVPVDRAERREVLENEVDKDNMNRILAECTEAFLAYAEDLNALNYAYIMKHKKSFT